MKRVLIGLVLLAGGVLMTPGVSKASPDSDASEAVRYSGDGGDELGTRIASLDATDNAGQVVGLPWRINFFGHPANALCVSTNGTVSPLLLTDDQFDAWSGVDDDDALVDDETAPNACAGYDHDLATIAGENDADLISALGSDVVLNWNNAFASDPCDECSGGSIWWNEIEVDGQDAVAVTWNEVSMHTSVWGMSPEYSGAGGSWSGDEWFDGNWTQDSPNTFQIVIVKGEAGNDSDGYDLTIELNYGTMGDGSDGYGILKDEAGEPLTNGDWPVFECGSSSMMNRQAGVRALNRYLARAAIPYSMSSYPQLIEWDRNHFCRWGIGLAKYDSESDSAAGYELFRRIPVGELTDGGGYELDANSLHSDVDGRYVIAMVDGEVDLRETNYTRFNFDRQFGDYWTSVCLDCTEDVEAEDGEVVTDTEETIPLEETVPIVAVGNRELLADTLQPASPITLADGNLPSVAVGAVEAWIDGSTDPVTLTAGADGVWTIDGDGLSLTIDASPGAAPTITDDESVAVSGSDLEPGSLVDVWAFSTPTFLGSFTVETDGSFSGSIELPAALAAGDHTLQINGTSADGRVRSVNIGVRVVDSNFTLPKTGGTDTVALVALWLLVGGLVLTAARRRYPGTWNLRG